MTHPSYDSPLPSPGQLRLALPRFESPTLLGKGGMGAVYSAYDTQRHQQVALKLTLRSAFGEEHLGDVQRRFFREFELLRRAQACEHVVNVFDRGVLRLQQGEHLALWYTMELCSGSVGEQMSLFTVRQRADVALQVLDGLAFLAAQGVAHRDVKPANAFVQLNGDRVLVRLGDFGIAKGLRPDDLSSATLTAMDVKLGSPRYMAPEFIIAMSNDPIDLRKADQYSTGVLLFELFSQGKGPINYPPPPAMMMDLFRAKLQPLRPLKVPGLSYSARGIERVLHRMISPKPSDRYPHIAAAERSLRSALLQYDLL